MEELKPITKNEFEKMVKMHNEWLRGGGGRRANFFGDRFEQDISMSGIDLRLSDFRNSFLSGMDMSWANLSRADLTNADLTSANLYGACLDYIRFDGADLTGADLSNASIVWANLSHADLGRAKLHGSSLIHSTMHCANLRNANLSHANLRYADLSHAYLTGADLRYADLSHANLFEADLTGANLDGADLGRADICGCRFDETETARMGIVLESPITGYKKSKDGRIVTLEIPEGAIVFSINNRKCRTNVAKVIDTEGEAELTSSYDNGFKYRVGEELRVKDFCMAYNVVCGPGIHFFRTKEEAMQYQIF